MIKPLRNGVLIRPSDAQSETKIGIIIQSAIANEGIVKAIGAEVKELKVNDRVRYDIQSVAKVDSYVLCREADVLCVLE